jgi:hypothetical protein
MLDVQNEPVRAPGWAKTISETVEYARQSPGRALALGLIAGILTFGGAVARPFVARAAKRVAEWINPPTIDARKLLGRCYFWADAGGGGFWSPIISVMPNTIRDGQPLVIQYDWSHGRLTGQIQGHTYTGQWDQTAPHAGQGAFQLKFFDKDFKTARGTWSYSATPDQVPLAAINNCP